MELVERYRALNESFNDKLNFRFGYGAGFFSEYNNMILAMAYCLKHRITFTLYSKNAWFSTAGWTCFFEPFCCEYRAEFLSEINTREAPPRPGRKTRLLSLLASVFYRIGYFTWELWYQFTGKNMEQETFTIPELGINGDLRSACQVLNDIAWRYNADTQKSVNQLIESVTLPDEYLGFHIRGGDKYIEDNLHPVSSYFNEMAVCSHCRNAFVLTDDYRIIETIRQEYPAWTIFTLCRKEERGYYHQEFMRMEPDLIREQTLRLFASTDILLKSKLFIGTFSSNPGMYMGMRMNRDRCLGVGGAEWRIWS